MLKDGLHNTVDIYILNRDTSDRLKTGEEPRLSEEPSLKNVPCRIIKDKKVIFKGNLKLEDGYKMIDIATNVEYEIRQGNIVRGIVNTHHSSYEIRLKRESGAY